MKILPSLPGTVVNPATREWIPNSFEGFLHELNHIVECCKAKNSLALFRGHRKREWLLDSTFVRSVKTTLFNIQPKDRLSQRVASSAEFHPAILNLFLLKFGVLARPSDELEEVAKQYGIDAWFEFMKRLQQYPEMEDGFFFLKGSNLLDWTQSSDVALYFANENRNSAGAIYICDATATGKTLQVLPLGKILDKMSEDGKVNSLGAPLLFSPPKQILCHRAKNQQAVYFAQMDLRYDLEYIWRLRESELSGEIISIKLILPADSEAEANEHLSKKGITRAFIYPDE
ncbi:MAG: hypothetical protein ABL911_08275 [Gallionella sp.]|nr:hypothetical protein [Gallionella sp.]